MGRGPLFGFYGADAFGQVGVIVKQPMRKESEERGPRDKRISRPADEADGRSAPAFTGARSRCGERNRASATEMRVAARVRIAVSERRGGANAGARSAGKRCRWSRFCGCQGTQRTGRGGRKADGGTCAMPELDCQTLGHNSHCAPGPRFREIVAILTYTVL